MTVLHTPRPGKHISYVSRRRDERISLRSGGRRATRLEAARSSERHTGRCGKTRRHNSNQRSGAGGERGEPALRDDSGCLDGVVCRVVRWEVMGAGEGTRDEG